jgi:hypothetical protein
VTLALLGNTLLRTAITRNLVSFPAQIQPFMKRSSGDLQERIVTLFFVRGWSVRMICDRYGLSKAMAHKLLAEWRIRAVEAGCIQEIQPGGLDALTAAAKLEEKEEAAAVYKYVPVLPVTEINFAIELSFVKAGQVSNAGGGNSGLSAGLGL